MHTALLKILLFVVLLLETNASLAQTFKLSEPIDVSLDYDSRLIGAYNDTILLYRRTRTRFLVHGLDTALQWSKETEILSKYSNSIRPITVVTDKDYFCVVYQYVQRGKVYVRVQRLDGAARVLADYEVAQLEHGGFSRYFQNVLSENKKSLTLYNVTFEGDLEVINIDLKSEKARWQRFLNLDDVNYYKEFLQITNNNSGDVFVIFEKNNLRRQQTNHHFVIFRFDADAQMLRYELPFPEKLSYNSYFIYDELNQKLVGAGLYLGNAYQQAQGIFYTKTDLKTPASVYISEFEESFMRSLTGEKRKQINGITNFYIQQLILRRDGGVIFIAEQQLKYEYQMVSLFFQNDPGFQQADYLFENVLVASIHPTGVVHWKNVLFKNQNSENDGGKYSSFFLFKTVTNLRLLYNDQVRWDTAMFEYQIDGLGKVQRNVLPRPSDDFLLPEFRHAIQLSAKELAVTTLRNNKLRVVKISY